MRELTLFLEQQWNCLLQSEPDQSKSHRHHRHTSRQTSAKSTKRAASQSFCPAKLGQSDAGALEAYNRANQAATHVASCPATASE